MPEHHTGTYGNTGTHTGTHTGTPRPNSQHQPPQKSNSKNNAIPRPSPVFPAPPAKIEEVSKSDILGYGATLDPSHPVGPGEFARRLIIIG